jgi:hypothetical protein
MLQIDAPRRQVFIKMKQCNELHRIIQETNGLKEYKHFNGEISQVRIEMAGLGTKRIRIANLPRRFRKDQLDLPLHNMEILNPFKRNHGQKRIAMQYLTALK